MEKVPQEIPFLEKPSFWRRKVVNPLRENASGGYVDFLFCVDFAPVLPDDLINNRTTKMK